MWFYWIMFSIPLVSVAGNVRNESQRFGWGFVIVIFTILIGLRYEVGGDWYNYVRHFETVLFYSFSEILTREDPGYYLLSWLIAKAGWSNIWLNFFCAVFVMAGVQSFCRNQPLPWLALLVAIPYLLIVVSMGYSRQATALGFAMIGLTALGKKEIGKFIFWVVVGALFHKTAVLLLPIAGLAATEKRIWTFLWASVVAVGGAYFLMFDYADELWQVYVETDYANASQGGQIRVFMNMVPAVILFLFRNRLFYYPSEKKLWLWLSFLALMCIPLLSISATAVDRLALYFIPVQIFTFSRLPYLSTDRGTFNIIVLGVIAYYALVMYVWLNFANNANMWLPYNNALFS